jgi:hypothetical protein
MHENVRNLKREMHEMQNTRDALKREMREIREHENAKIVKVAALQQVQYKVLLYGLYAPIET